MPRRRGRRAGRRRTSPNTLGYCVFGTVTLSSSSGTKSINFADLGLSPTDLIRPNRVRGAVFRMASPQPVVVSLKAFGLELASDCSSAISRPQVVGVTTQTLRVTNPRIMDYQTRASNDVAITIIYGPGLGTLTYTGYVNVQFTHFDAPHTVSLLASLTLGDRDDDDAAALVAS